MVETGWILVGVNLLGILGAYIAGFLLKTKKRIVLLTILSFINSITIIFSANSNIKVVAIILFWIHVLFTSSDEVVRYTILHERVIGKQRTTLVSLNNTLNAGATLVALMINGWLSDSFSIGVSWTIMAVTGFILTAIGYSVVNFKISNKKSDVYGGE